MLLYSLGGSAYCYAPSFMEKLVFSLKISVVGKKAADYLASLKM